MAAQQVLAFDQAPDNALTVVAPDEFDRQKLRETFVPLDRTELYAVWDLDSIRAARDEHMKGTFRRSAAMAQAMKCNPQIFSALRNRIAPQRGLPRKFHARGKRLELEAERTFGRRGVAIATTADANEVFSMLGLSVGQNVWKPRSDGSRLDVELRPWPMRSVLWDPVKRQLMAQTTKGLKPITHGDGKWVVFMLHRAEPWQAGAVKPLGELWGDLAFGKRDRSQHAEAHGQMKWIGTLPPGVAINSPEGNEFAKGLQNLRRGRSGMVTLHGSEVAMKESVAQGWQIFRELIIGDTGEVDRVLLGQDGALKAEGGNYIQAAQLHKVSYNIVEGDIHCLEDGINHGVLRPWSIVNIGDPEAISRVEWLLPDVDQDARRESLSKRTDSFNRAIKESRAAGFIVDQAFVDKLATEYGVEAPKLDPKPAAPAPAPQET